MTAGWRWTSLIKDTTKLFEAIATMLGRGVAEVRSEGRTSFDRSQQVRDEVVLEAVGLSGATSWTTSRRRSTWRGAGSPACSLSRSETVRAIFGTQRLDAGSVEVRGRRVPATG